MVTRQPAVFGGSSLYGLHGLHRYEQDHPCIYVIRGVCVNVATRVITYNYDHLYRLTSADYRSTGLTAGSTGESFAYGYDPVGNPTSTALRGAGCRTVHTRTLTATTVITYAYDAANRRGQSHLNWK
jgi:hypothetical protein